MNEKDKYVLDTSAIFAFLEDEDGADTVQDLLEKAKDNTVTIFIAFISFAEVYYITIQEKGALEAQRRNALISKLTIQRVESTEELSLIAGELKAKYRISLADAWIAAVAKYKGAVLVHKDPEFGQVESEIQVLKFALQILI